MSPTREKAPDVPADTDVTADDTTEATTPEAEPEAEPTKLTKAQKALPVRHSVNTWWCPIDDFSMPLDMAECPNDGFQRPDFPAEG